MFVFKFESKDELVVNNQSFGGRSIVLANPWKSLKFQIVLIIQPNTSVWMSSYMSVWVVYLEQEPALQLIMLGWRPENCSILYRKNLPVQQFLVTVPQHQNILLPIQAQYITAWKWVCQRNVHSCILIIHHQLFLRAVYLFQIHKFFTQNIYSTEKKLFCI